MGIGRPKKEIDKEEFEKLCALQCTMLEICDWFAISDKTLTRWCKDTYNVPFSEVYAQKRERGKVSLRRAQFQIAQHSAAMAIFLGKNYLGQSDGDYKKEQYQQKMLELKEREVKAREEGW